MLIILCEALKKVNKELKGHYSVRPKKEKTICKRGNVFCSEFEEVTAKQRKPIFDQYISQSSHARVESKYVEWISVDSELISRDKYTNVSQA